MTCTYVRGQTACRLPYLLDNPRSNNSWFHFAFYVGRTMAANSAIFSYETLIHAIAGASVSTRSARSFKEFDSYMPAWQQCLVNDSINEPTPSLYPKIPSGFQIKSFPSRKKSTSPFRKCSLTRYLVEFNPLNGSLDNGSIRLIVQDMASPILYCSLGCMISCPWQLPRMRDWRKIRKTQMLRNKEFPSRVVYAT